MHYKKKLTLSSAQGKRIFTDVLLATIRRLRDPVEQEHYLKKIAEITETSWKPCSSKLFQNRQSQETAKKPKVGPKALDRASVEYQRLQDHFWQ
jgi:DNA primase